MRALPIVLVLFACGSKPPKPSTVAQPSGPLLYDRLGGMDAIKGIVKDFVEEQLVKGPLAARFTNVDVPRLEENLARQLCEQSGGPCKYVGRAMKEAHGSLAITEADFTAFLGEFQKTLAKFKVDAPEQRELLELWRKHHDEIVAPQ